MKAKFIDVDGDNVEWVDKAGQHWFTKLSGNGEIPEQVKAWIEAGNTPAPYITPPIVPEQNTRIEAAILALVKKGLITEDDITLELPKTSPTALRTG